MKPSRSQIVMSIPSARAVALLAFAAPALAQGQLNDTGQLACYNGAVVSGTVSIGTPDPDVAGSGVQDCTQGSAAADALGKIVKTGASTAPGRDYTKIANDGSELPASAFLGGHPADWACTRDNLTGLVWEIKTDGEDAVPDRFLRDKDHTYGWYDTHPAAHGGHVGNRGSDTCHGTLPDNLCNTSAFRDAVNALAGADRLCGATDWRMPTGKELQSLVHYGAASGPYIDVPWFPNTGNGDYWAGNTYAADASSAWGVFFGYGSLTPLGKSFRQQVRLVRGGP